MAGTAIERGRVPRRLAALTCVVMAVGLASAVPAVAASDPPGVFGAAVTIAASQDLASQHPYDVAVTPSGTAYVGWIGAATTPNGQDTRTINLCTLPRSATQCRGGVQSVSAIDATSATGLHVVATPTGVELLWSFGDSTSGSIAEADATGGQNLTGEGVQWSAPADAELLAATLDPNGQLWTVADGGVGTTTLQVNDGPVATTLTAPWAVSNASLAFAGSTSILALTRYGSATTPVSYASAPSGGSWSGFHRVAGTWANGDASLVRARHGVRLVTGVNNSSYRPVIVAWNGTGFNAPRLTSDHDTSAGLRSHDSATDPSGRVADVGWEGNRLAVAAYPDDRHAAVSRARMRGTTTFAPQIGESTRGVATVAWSRVSGSGGSDLLVSRFRLATVSTSHAGSSRGGRAVLTGPVNCLPVSNSRVALAIHRNRGWKVRSHSVTLDGKRLSKGFVDGAALASGTTHTLRGDVVFVRNGSRVSATPTLTFRTC